MTVTDNVPFDPAAALRRGDEADENQSQGGFRKEPHWDLKKGEEAVLRFLQDSPDWFRASTHRFIPTKAEPADYEGKWPSMLPATCRKEKSFAPVYGPDVICPICISGIKNKFDRDASKPDDLRWTLAIERQQVEGDGSEAMGGPEMKGKIGYRDKQVEIPILDADGKPTDEKITVPSVVIVSNTMYMMMGSLKANGETYGTLRDRDYKIKRVDNPSGKGTTYQVFPLDKNPAILPGTEHWAFYDLAVEAFGLNLPTLIFNKSKEDYYKKFFLEEDGFLSVDVRRQTGALAPAKTAAAKTSSSSGATPATTHVETPNADALAAMKARISKQG